MIESGPGLGLRRVSRPVTSIPCPYPSMRKDPILQRLSRLLLQRRHDLQRLTNSVASRSVLHNIANLGKSALPEAPTLKIQAPRGRDQLATDVGARFRAVGPDPKQ